MFVFPFVRLADFNYFQGYNRYIMLPAMRKFLVLCVSFFLWQHDYAQVNVNDSAAVKTYIDGLNRSLDSAVASKNIPFLQKHYADDFHFTHGTGQLDSKKSWIAFVAKPSTEYLYRRHDSTAVEWHRNVAIVTGTLTVKRNTSDAGYALNYVRVFAIRNNVWQLLSHRTTKEWHY
jgi:hypothetical protein